MTDAEVLKKAIEKAGEKADIVRLFNDELFNTDGNGLRMDLVRGYLFDHSFAKAFWGEDMVTDMENPTYKGGEPLIEAWKWHLKQMVLEENPLDYIHKFIEEEDGKEV
jgi:hypothetical protein